MTAMSVGPPITSTDCGAIGARREKMPIERQPINPVSKGHVPSSTSHKIRDGESWDTLASAYNTTPHKLMYANFRTLVPAEINWYLRNYVGCQQQSADGRNWIFSSAARPGVIYVPVDMTKFELPPEVSLILNGANPEVMNLPLEKKLEIVVRAAMSSSRVEREIKEQLGSLLHPANIAIMGSVVTVWVVSHFFVAGEVIDVIALFVAAVALGMTAATAADKLYRFAYYTYNAKSDADLDQAAEFLVEAVVLIGIEAVLAVLLYLVPKQPFRNPQLGRSARMPTKAQDLANRHGPSSWRHEPVEISVGVVDDTATLGKTDVFGDIWIANKKLIMQFGDIRIFRALTTDERAAIRFHEQVHQWLVPKLYPLRRLRVYLAQESYNRSYVLRYLEEALAETYSKVRMAGLNPDAIMEGIRFPVQNGYIRLENPAAQAAVEAAGWAAQKAAAKSLILEEVKGALLGPILVSSSMWLAYFSMEMPG
jgi:hypothetical protein